MYIIQKRTSKIILIALCVLNMALITALSMQDAVHSEKLSQNITERIIVSEPKYKNIPEQEKKGLVEKYDGTIRSIAHFSLFFLLGLHLFLALNAFECRRAIIIALLCCIVYALFDESLQEWLNAGRTFELIDLIKDWAGSFVGVVIAILFNRKILWSVKRNETLQ